MSIFVDQKTEQVGGIYKTTRKIRWGVVLAAVLVFLWMLGMVQSKAATTTDHAASQSVELVAA